MPEEQSGYVVDFRRKPEQQSGESAAGEAKNQSNESGQ
jgi:hypothetical protein